MTALGPNPTSMDQREDVGAAVPIFVQARFEPKPFWHWMGKRWIVIAYLRPRDVSVGVQFMWGGAALLAWPFMLAICNHRKMPSGPSRAQGAA